MSLNFGFGEQLGNFLSLGFGYVEIEIIIKKEEVIVKIIYHRPNRHSRKTTRFGHI